MGSVGGPAGTRSHCRGQVKGGRGTDEKSSSPEDFQDAFARIERAVDAGDADLSALGFWRLLRRVKEEPALSAHWADQAGRIDGKAFERRVRVRLPVWLGFGGLSNARAWAAWATLGIGVVQVVTDAVWSTKHSDWKKVRRERRLAAGQRAARV